MYFDLKYLEVDLPEDILKLKWFGDFKGALRVIDLRMKQDIPKALYKRLELEKEILRRLPETYPYTREDALGILRDHIDGFEEAELNRLQDEGAVDWIYVYGTVHYKNNFLKNLLKTRGAYAKRVKDRELIREQLADSELLDKTIGEMKAEGGLSLLMQVEASLRVKKEYEREGDTIRVHLPIPIEYAQVRDFRIINSSPEISFISKETYPQRTVCFEGALREEQEFSVTYEFVNHMNYVELDWEKVWEKQPDFSTEEQHPHIRFTSYIRELTEEIVGKEQNALKKARKIYDYITTHVMYSFVRPYAALNDIVGYAATGLKGDCGMQSLLFITMCRYVGIPAKWQAGIYSTPLEQGCHDWAQFYVEPYGWVYADCSFGGDAYREGSTDRWNFYFGNLDPFRIPTASEFQYEQMPPKKWMRNDPYDNQTGEAEYEDFGLTGDALETKIKILKIEPVSRREI